jgi:hypothetical protein
VRAFLALVLLMLIAAAQSRADIAQEAEQHGDIDVTVSLDANGQGGRAEAAVRIHASPETIWPILTSCAEELRLVPGLVSCEVVDTAPDGSWQMIHQVIGYWFLPKVTYELRATYEYPVRVRIERVAGDLRTLGCSWYLESEGEYTVAHYSLDMTPGFWVPHWMVKFFLKHDLPKMLRDLRSRAEASYGAGR